jgi:catechol 2,3-dioxygenase-like lactoylglutathione lyase family enzyme
MPTDPRPQSTNTVLSGAGFHHIALRARDFDRSFAFYTEKLGFKLAHQWGEGEGRIALLDIGDGNYIELFASKPGQTPPEGGEVPAPWPFFHLAIRSSNVDADIEHVRALGCPITVEPKSVPVNGKTIRVGFFLGPDGEVLEFFTHVNEAGETQL